MGRKKKGKEIAHGVLTVLFLERVLVGGIVRVASLKEATSPAGTICEGLVKRTVCCVYLLMGDSW